MTEERLIPAKEAAKFLGVDRTTLYALMAREGSNLESVKIGARRMFRQSALEAYVNQNTHSKKKEGLRHISELAREWYEKLVQLQESKNAGEFDEVHLYAEEQKDQEALISDMERTFDALDKAECRMRATQGGEPKTIREWLHRDLKRVLGL